MTRDRIRRIAGNAAVLIVSTVMMMLFVEAALRLFLYGTLASADFFDHKLLFQAHPTRGSAREPNASAFHRKIDFKVWMKTNSKGFRDDDHPYEPEPGTFRIVVLGDSFMEGAGVHQHEALPQVLEQKLADRQVEVINLGVGGYGTVQEMIVFDEEGIKYKPNLVLLAVYAYNDLANNTQSMNIGLYGNDDRRKFGRPYPIWDKRGRFSAFQPPEYDRVVASIEDMHAGLRAENEGIVRLDKVLAFRLFQEWRRGRRLGGRKWKFPLDPNIWYAPMLDSFDPSYEENSRYSTEDYAAMANEGWQTTLRLVSLMNEKAANAGAKFAFFHIPARVQIDPYFRRKSKQFYPNLGWNINRPSGRFKHFSERWSIPFFDLQPTLEQAQKEGGPKLYFRIDDDHWTARSHRLSADALIQFLDSADLLPPK